MNIWLIHPGQSKDDIEHNIAQQNNTTRTRKSIMQIPPIVTESLRLTARNVNTTQKAVCKISSKWRRL